MSSVTRALESNAFFQETSEVEKYLDEDKNCSYFWVKLQALSLERHFASHKIKITFFVYFWNFTFSNDTKLPTDGRLKITVYLSLNNFTYMCFWTYIKNASIEIKWALSLPPSLSLTHTNLTNWIRLLETSRERERESKKGQNRWGQVLFPFYVKLKGFTPYSMNTCFNRCESRM